MIRSIGSVSVWDFDDRILDRIRSEPLRLIRENNPPSEVVRLGRLVDPQISVTGSKQVIGSSPGGPEHPDVVVVGVCQGRARTDDKKCWIEMGPSVESVCIVDFAQQLSLSTHSVLEIWIPDQEYAYTVVDKRLDSTPEKEIAVGESLQQWCRSRYPNAVIRRTSDQEVRSELYSLVADSVFSALFPTGVPTPYNASGSVFWQELQFLATVAVFLRSVMYENKRAWLVADHEQIRPMAAAWCMAPQSVKMFPLWPCPRLRWVPPSVSRHKDRYAERFLTRAKKYNRRMFRGDGVHDMLFAKMSREQVKRHVEHDSREELCEDTVREVLRFIEGRNVTCSLLTVDEVADALYNGLSRLQSAVPAP